MVAMILITFVATFICFPVSFLHAPILKSIFTLAHWGSDESVTEPLKAVEDSWHFATTSLQL